VKNWEMLRKVEEALKVIKHSDVYRYIELDYRNVSCNFDTIYFLADFLRRRIEDCKFIQAIIITDYGETYTLSVDEEKIVVGILDNSFNYTVEKIVNFK